MPLLLRVLPVPLLVLGLMGCKGRQPSAHDAAESQAARPMTDDASAASKGPPAQKAMDDSTGPAGRERPAAAAPWPPGLPRLKPVIDKPFPDGATDEQVCEAIGNTQEKDLWVRFGHLVPMYIPGSLFIVQATEKDRSRVEGFINDYHGRAYFPTVKACSKGGLLAYVRGLKGWEPVDDREPGHPHLAAQIRKGLKLPVPESFGYFNDQARLSEYCRADAVLCESLVKVDYANEGEGLCARALSQARVPREDRSSALELCRQMPRADLACTEYAFDGSEADRCRERIRTTLTGD